MDLFNLLIVAGVLLTLLALAIGFLFVESRRTRRQIRAWRDTVALGGYLGSTGTDRWTRVTGGGGR